MVWFIYHYIPTYLNQTTKLFSFQCIFRYFVVYSSIDQYCLFQQVIECSDLYGQHRRLLVTAVPHPYGLTVAGDYIYWTDWRKIAIQRADKMTGDKVTTIRGDLPGLMAIHAVQLGNVGTSAISICVSTKLRVFSCCPCHQGCGCHGYSSFLHFTFLYSLLPHYIAFQQSPTPMFCGYSRHTLSRLLLYCNKCTHHPPICIVTVISII